MKSFNCFILLGLLMLSMFALSQAQNFKDDGPVKCGYLFDGISRGRDLGRQKKSYPISANWQDFDQRDNKNDLITYQFAIISQERLTKTILNSGPEAPTKKRCRYDDGLEGGDPDVVGWTTLTFDGKRSTKDNEGAFRIYDLDLKNKYRYYVILSATIHDENGKDETIYTNTDGVYITERDNYDDDDDDDSEYLLLLLLLLLIPCCLLLLLLILLLVARGRGDDKYKTVVQRTG
eukprot:TRINITY_DN12401_c0_g1_i1.p1 TRINITY_DN12401_c0_g1~~TRINITY_DN12401_c0_g1_i1.p1  ORF type:complete len:234 (+),score=48.14 TRINITY_DN12401_c0_g1_i1:115-816(+)